MEIFEALVNSMNIGKLEKIILIKSKEEVENLIREKKYVDASIKCENLIHAIKVLNVEPKRSAILKNVVDLSYKIRSKYIRTSDIKIGTYINATVEAKPKPKIINERVVGGDPMFFLMDDYGTNYECFIKNRKDLNVGDSDFLWITKIDFLKKRIYLEPRLEKHDKIYARVESFTQRNEPYFRFMNYDGFIKINDGVGITKIEKERCYLLETEYTRLSKVIDKKNRHIKRIGILFGHAFEEVDEKRFIENKEKILRAS